VDKSKALPGHTVSVRFIKRWIVFPMLEVTVIYNALGKSKVKDDDQAAKRNDVGCGIFQVVGVRLG
jgi:hypothetical protein